MPTKGVAPKQPKPRVRRLLASREPQLVENTKKSLLLRGNSTSQLVTSLLTDIVSRWRMWLCVVELRWKRE